MTPPNVVFVPAAVTSARYVLSGDLVYANATRFATTNESETGDVSDFEPYAFTSIRNQTTYIRFIISLTGWATVDDFLSAGGLDDATFSVNGSAFAHTSLTTNTGSGTLLFINLNATALAVSAFWATMADGDPFELALNY